MKLRIGEIEYDYITAQNKVSLGVLMDLKSQGGPGRKGIAIGLDLLSEAITTTDDASVVEDDERVLYSVAGLIFIAKRHVGEQITWEEACSYNWTDFNFIFEESDVPHAEPDPQKPPGEATQPGGEIKNEKPSNAKPSPSSRSRTSKPRSTSTSPK